jgi:hypothetical protein
MWRDHMPQLVSSTPEYPRVPFECCIGKGGQQVRAAAEASGLLPLFESLNLSTDAPSLERAVNWLADQGADTVADLRELPPGTYTCKELAESLGLPVVKAQRLLTALEGARSAASRRIAPLESQPFCMTGASQMHSPPPQPQPAAQVGPPLLQYHVLCLDPP